MRLATCLAVLALVLSGPALASNRHPTQSEVESELICPTCHETLDQSSSQIAQQMKAFIRERIAAGDTKSQIKGKLVALFGKRILAEPPKHGFDLLAWVLPLGGILLGAGALAVGAWRWSRSSERDAPPEPGVLDPELDQLVDRELSRFDA